MRSYTFSFLFVCVALTKICPAAYYKEDVLDKY